MSAPTDFLAEAARQWPDRPALDDGSLQWSYAELDREVEEWATVLQREGSSSGRVVAVVLGPSSEAVRAIHAVLRTGAVVAPLHPVWSEAERRIAIDRLEPVAVVSSSEKAAGTGRPLAEGTRGPVAVGRESSGETTWEAPVVVGREPTGKVTWEPNTRVVIWSSGTGGRARGVALSEEGLRTNARASAERLGLGPSDRWYAALPMAHVGGLALLTRAVLLGSCVVVRKGFDREELVELIRGGEVSHASLVPTMLARLLEAWEERPVPSSLRCLLVGGAGTASSLVQRAGILGLPIALTYGLTEATSQVATAPPKLVLRKPGTVGPALPGVEIRVSEEGEILVRGPTVARPAPPEVEPLTEGDGWLATRDLGHLDEEGHLWVTGRLDDRILTGGVTVHPLEIEALIRDHPGLADAAVFGQPDEEWGEIIAAAVVRAPGAALDLEELDGWLRARLSPVKRPRRLVEVASLPLNPVGKVDRRRLRADLSP